MLRLKFLFSAVPLIAVAVLARIAFFPTTHPCITNGADTLHVASAPWHADLHVSFTDDPKLATVRVAISDSAETADFAVIDDVDSIEDSVCETTPATQFVAISDDASGSTPVIYLSHDEGPSDYRVFVRSKRFTERDAAALVVDARAEHVHLATTL
jgi:hypothetical protein